MRFATKATFVFLLWLLPALSVFSQAQYRFRHFTKAEGLSQNTVNDIIEDDYGFVWVATQDGLNRLDGYTSRVFRWSRTDSSSLSDNFVLDIEKGTDGRLWFATRNGISRYREKDQGFDRYNHLFSSSQEENTYYKLLANGDSMSVASHEVRDVQTQRVLAGLSGVEERHLLFPLAKGRFYDVTFKSVFLLSADKCERIADMPAGIGSFNSEISQSLVLHDSILWIATPRGLVRCDLVNGRSSMFALEQAPSVFCLMADREGRIWAGTSNGIYVIEDRKVITHLVQREKEEAGLNSNAISALYQDRKGLIWVGTFDKGLNIYDPGSSLFHKIVSDQMLPLIGSNTILGACLDKDNNLYVGNDGNILRLSIHAGKRWSRIRSLEEVRTEKLPCHVNGIITSLLYDSTRHQLLIAVKGSGLIVFSLYSNRIEKQYVNKKGDPFSLCNNEIFRLRQGDPGTWICTEGGLNFLSGAGNISVFTANPDYPFRRSDMSSGYIMDAFADGRNIWVAGAAGLMKYDQRKGTFLVLEHNDHNTSSISHDIVTGISPKNAHELWISTLGRGLNLFDKKSMRFRAIGSDPLLRNDHMYAVLSDKEENAWACSSEGLSCYLSGKAAFISFNRDHGLVSDESSIASCFRSAWGDLFFGSREGLVFFDPAAVLARKDQHQLLITDIRINYKDLPGEKHLGEKSVFSARHLSLDHTDKVITISFTDIDFVSPGRIVYQYMLKGHDAEWITTAAYNRVAQYSNLPSGTYEFLLRSRKISEAAFSAPVSLTLQVYPPFWLTWWFVLVMVIVAIAAIIGIVLYFTRLRMQRALRNIEMEQKLQKERERISKDLHDNLGSQLTYITSSMDTIRYQAEKNEIGSAIGRLDDLSDFTRNTISELRQTIWTLNRDEIPAAELKNKLHDFLRQFFSNAKDLQISFTFDMDEAYFFKPKEAINIYRVVQEAANNAYKYSRATQISFATNIVKDTLTIEFTDNGQGFDNDGKKGAGIGNMQKRMEEIGAAFTLVTAPGKGTRIIIRKIGRMP